MKNNLAYICSPYRGNILEKARNILYARHLTKLDLLHKTVYPICEGFIQSATVDMGNGIKGKISITTKGIVKVTRTKTNTSTYEA